MKLFRPIAVLAIATTLTFSSTAVADEESFELIGVDFAHSLGLSGAGMRIAVLDNALDPEHPYIQGKIFFGYCTVTEGDIFRDHAYCEGGGREAEGIDAAKGAFLTEAGMNDLGASGNRQYIGANHGLMVTGLIAGNSVAQAPGGIAYNSEIAMFATGSEADNVESAMRVLANRAQELEIDAVSISLSNPGGDSGRVECSRTDEAKRLDRYVQILKEADIPVFAASGNEGNYYGFSQRPACLEDVYAIGATNREGDLHEYSNSGWNLDLVAPADFISATHNNEYGPSSGTSSATPVTAASYLLIKERFPDLRHELIIDAMKLTGEPVEDIMYDNVRLINLQNTIEYLDANADQLASGAVVIDPAEIALRPKGRFAEMMGSQLDPRLTADSTAGGQSLTDDNQEPTESDLAVASGSNDGDGGLLLGLGGVILGLLVGFGFASVSLRFQKRQQN